MSLLRRLRLWLSRPDTSDIPEAGEEWFAQARLRRPSVPRPAPLEQFFADSRCPDCGSPELDTWEDSGHDVCITCRDCRASFGVQLPPFSMIERLR